MSDMNCPTCGNPLQADVLSGEIRPCSRCGSVREKPAPDPEHQHRINKQKGFEIATIIVLVIVGVGYFAISNRPPAGQGDGPNTVAKLLQIVTSHDYTSEGESLILGRKFHSYRRQEGVFQSTIDLIEDAETNSVEAILIVVSHPAGKTFPPDDVAEAATQDALNTMVRFGEALIPSSPPALQKAAITMSLGKRGILHNKGVAQTSDGWKVTYITYREYEEDGEDVPLLLFLYQRLSAASSPDLADFNRVLYESINVGQDPKSGLRAYEAELRNH